jgi:hypothetical protein
MYESGMIFKLLLAVPFRHLQHVGHKPIFSGELVRKRQMIDFLVFLQFLIYVNVQAAGTPNDVSVMGLCVHECVRLKHCLHELRVGFM